MQFLEVTKQTSLRDLSDAVGSRNVDTVLATNGLTRSPNIGKMFIEKCNNIVQSVTEPLTVNRKSTLLNTLTSDSEVFERACLMSDPEWHVFSELNTFHSALKIPSSISMPSSAQLLGNNQPVSNSVYQKTMMQLKETGTINPSIFTDYASGSLGPASISFGLAGSQGDVFDAFHIPWGEIQLYSTLADETIDFPCYPEELEYARAANYTTMEETLYQYEPWFVYESSGPREQSVVFNIHRDMWTGNHMDGKANELIRFCEANCYPEYDGAAVNTATVTLYIKGTAFITGIMTGVNVHWSGPIGQDGWYLQCELTLTINEVAAKPLNFSTIRKMNVIGGYN